MPIQLIRAFGILKKAAAIVNTEMGLLDVKLSRAIQDACDEVCCGFAFSDCFLTVSIVFVAYRLLMVSWMISSLLLCGRRVRAHRPT